MNKTKTTNAIDGLTGSKTRFWLQENFSSLKEQLNTSLCLFIDADTLICFNDIYGMQLTDNEMSRAISIARQNAMIYEVIRIGGDEFAAICNSEFTFAEIDNLLLELANENFKVDVKYSNIEYFSFSACISSGKLLNSYEDFLELSKAAFSAIENAKVHIDNRKYQHQKILTTIEPIRHECNTLFNNKNTV